MLDPTTKTMPALTSWQSTVTELLAKAAELCADHDVDVDAFVRGAYTAYLDSRPGLREQLEELQLRSQLERMREDGKIAKA